MESPTTHTALRRCVPLITLIALAVMGVVAASHFALRDALCIVASFVVALVVPEWLYNSGGRTSPVGHLVLAAAWCIVAASALHHFVEWTSLPHTSLAHPAVGGDAARYYGFACYYYDGSTPTPPDVAFPGLSLLIIGLWKVLGMSVVWPVAMNVMLTLVAVVLVGRLTCRLLRGRTTASAVQLTTLGMALTATLMFYLSHGALLLKEPGIYVSMAIVGLVLAGINGEAKPALRRWWLEAAAFTVAVLLMAFFRTTYLYFVILGAAMLVVRHWRLWWRRGAVLMAITMIAFWLGDNVAAYSADYHLQMIAGGDLMHNEFMKDAPRQVYSNFIGYYFYYSPLHRVFLLPLTASVQFIIPFPWIYEGGLAELFPRLAWGWYAVGGLALFYFFFISWRRADSLGTWAWWVALSWAVIAYVMAGTVSRYVLPLQQLLVPVAAYVLCLLHQGRYKKPMLWWSIGFVIVLAVTLVVCYHIQTDYLAQLTDYYHRGAAAVQ